MKITQGKVFASGTEIIAMPSQVKIAKVSGATYEEALANAQLIVDAFNVRQQINFELPELKEVVKAATDQIHELVRINHQLRTDLEKCYNELHKAAEKGNYPESFLQENGGRGLSEITGLL